MKRILLLVISLNVVTCLLAEDGYRLWLRYDKVDNAALLEQYRNRINTIVINGSSPTITAAKTELLTGLQGLLDKKIPEAKDLKSNCVVIASKAATSRAE